MSKATKSESFEDAVGRYLRYNKEALVNARADVYDAIIRTHNDNAMPGSRNSKKRDMLFARVGAYTMLIDGNSNHAWRKAAATTLADTESVMWS